MNLRINGVRVKTPHNFTYEEYDVTKANRLANADMAMEYIATKRKYLIAYQALTAKEYNLIWTQMRKNRPFFEVTLDLDGKDTSFLCYVGAIKRTGHIVFTGSEWVWKDVTFNFIEK